MPAPLPQAVLKLALAATPASLGRPPGDHQEKAVPSASGGRRTPRDKHQTAACDQLRPRPPHGRAALPRVNESSSGMPSFAWACCLRTLEPNIAMPGPPPLPCVPQGRHEKSPAFGRSGNAPARTPRAPAGRLSVRRISRLSAGDPSTPQQRFSGMAGSPRTGEPALPLIRNPTQSRLASKQEICIWL